MKRINVGFNTQEKRLEATNNLSNSRLGLLKPKEFWPPKGIKKSEKYIVEEIIRSEWFGIDLQSPNKMNETFEIYGGIEQFRKSLTYIFYYNEYTNSKNFRKKINQRTQFIKKIDSTPEGLWKSIPPPKFLRKKIKNIEGREELLLFRGSLR